MTNLELEQLLKKIYSKNFLNRFTFIKESEKNYQQSSFFKQTKMPLLDLFKEYEKYFNYTYDRDQYFAEVIYSIDFQYLTKKISESLEGVLDSEKFKKFFEEITSAFNIKELTEKNEELKNLFETVK